MQTAQEIEDNYLSKLTPSEIQRQLLALVARPGAMPGTRQMAFLPVETLLTYGLFFSVNPHRYGKSNIQTIPYQAIKLATFFSRPPRSITNKMLNLEGAWANGGKNDVALYAYLGIDPQRYVLLYREILATARTLGIGEKTLPDFLGLVDRAVPSTTATTKPGISSTSFSKVDIPTPQTGAFQYPAPLPDELTKAALANGANGSRQQPDSLLLAGQEELPATTTELLSGKDNAEELARVQTSFEMAETLTEKVVEQKIRLAQHRFAREVLLNYDYHCAFCGFTPPPGVPRHSSGLLRASHIKPWAVSTGKERVDVRNGLAACPIHDTAFDLGYLTVSGGGRTGGGGGEGSNDGNYRIEFSSVLLEGIRSNEATRHLFWFGGGGGKEQEEEGQTGSGGAVLILPATAQRPGAVYLAYHHEYIYR